MRLRWLDAFGQDVRHGLRALRGHPGFAAMVMATVALGIGATATMFTVVNAVLLEPLPYPQPSQLVAVLGVRRTGTEGTSYPNFESERDRNTVFGRMAGSTAHQLTLTGQEEPGLVTAVSVAGDYFPLLQVAPLLGRTLTPGDVTRGSAPVVLLSEALWRSRFGANRTIVGRAIALDQRPFTVVGVMPASFRDPIFPSRAEVWIPVFQDPLFGPFTAGRGGGLLGVIARLKPGVSIARAQAEMDGVGASLAADYPVTNTGRSIRLVPLADTIVGAVRPVLVVLFGAVGLLLLIALVNVANLLLVRAAARGTEFGVRFALGAGRGRLIRQLLTESLVVGCAGGLGGMLLASAAVGVLASALPAEIPRMRELAVDARVLGFTLILSVAASVLFGLAPALVSTTSRVGAGLRDGGRSGTGSARRRATNAFALVQIALAMVLLVASGLLLQSLLSLTSVNPGVDVRRVWKADVSLPRYEYATPAQWTAFVDQLLPAIQAQPGLEDTALGVPLPLIQRPVSLPFTMADGPAPPPGSPIQAADYVSISPGYFRVMKVPLLAGRPFDARDTMPAPPVTIVSEAFVRRFLTGTNPIGRHLVFAFQLFTPVAREVVGVVADVRDVSLHDAAGPMMYVPYDQAPFWGAGLVVRSGLEPTAIAAAIRRQVRAMDASLPVTDFEALSDGLSETVSPARFRAFLVGAFGLIALVMAAAGVFGVFSHSVLRRTREMGLRIALGAAPVTIRRMVLQEALRLAAGGLVIGVVAALILTRFLRSQLYAVSATDPWTFAITAVVLAAVALVAAYIPARRAMRIDPILALRADAG